MRRAAKRDQSEPEIVSALLAAGCKVWRELPCDLLIFSRGRFYCAEIKTPTKTGKRRARRDQEAQDRFIAETGTAGGTDARRGATGPTPR